ncbi:hypothetical protein [Haloarchaeobius sp. DFWS5]|uniref:hypothetical protein n=1 Tax=Haloarchaeobius sp. DFWS5 TaxID=3446114 RepID=UPI003EBCD24D
MTLRWAFLVVAVLAFTTFVLRLLLFFETGHWNSNLDTFQTVVAFACTLSMLYLFWRRG